MNIMLEMVEGKQTEKLYILDHINFASKILYIVQINFKKVILKKK